MELTQNQKRALLLLKRGSKIGVRLGSPSSGHYAAVSGEKRVEIALKTVEWAKKNRILNRDQVERLKKILRN